MLPLLPKIKPCDNMKISKIYGSEQKISGSKSPYISAFFALKFKQNNNITQ
jgi:hypothetical protein